MSCNPKTWDLDRTTSHIDQASSHDVLPSHQGQLFFCAIVSIRGFLLALDTKAEEILHFFSMNLVRLSARLERVLIFVRYIQISAFIGVIPVLFTGLVGIFLLDLAPFQGEAETQRHVSDIHFVCAF